MTSEPWDDKARARLEFNAKYGDWAARDALAEIDRRKSEWSEALDVIGRKMCPDLRLRASMLVPAAAVALVIDYLDARKAGVVAERDAAVDALGRERWEDRRGYAAKRGVGMDRPEVIRAVGRAAAGLPPEKEAPDGK